jgi:hypothetical protein
VDRIILLLSARMNGMFDDMDEEPTNMVETKNEKEEDVLTERSEKSEKSEVEDIEETQTPEQSNLYFPEGKTKPCQPTHQYTIHK